MKQILPIIIALVIISGGAFYGGMKYAQSKSPQGFAQGNFQDLRNLSPEERQQRFQQAGAAGMIGLSGGRSGNGTDSGFVAGEVISKDDTSITVKLQDGGSKIIFYSDSAEISKFVSGNATDLEIGKSVVINGKANEDGSVTAQSIQIRPEMNSVQ